MINHHNNSGCGNFSEKMQRTQEYIEALEEERRKIQVFQRELPLCLELVTQAIETCKQQLSGTAEYNFHGQSECSEQTSTDGPVLEEFIPLKRSSSSDEDEHQSHNTKRKDRVEVKNNDKASSKKSDWLRSVQLWNQTPDPPAKEESPRKVQIVEVKSNGNGGAFHPFKKEKEKEKSVVGTSAAAATQPPMTSGRSSGPAAAASSTADTGVKSNGDDGCKKEEKEREGQSQRKARRCWSPELHKRFLMALQQLGGSHVATPKQIRELMKVDGLTNDEVKSHLQKYRLHNRRPSSSIHNNNNNPQAPQFVVVGGIWVPPPEYAAIAATTTTTGSGEASGAANSNGIYAPVATLASPPPIRKQCNSDDRGSHSGGGDHHSRNSPVTSSSTDTTTASPATY